MLFAAKDPLCQVQTRPGRAGPTASRRAAARASWRPPSCRCSGPRAGRAFSYSPAADEAGLAARRLAAMLDREPDRQAVLSRFVAELSDRDEQLLRALLGDSG